MTGVTIWAYDNTPNPEATWEVLERCSATMGVRRAYRLTDDITGRERAVRFEASGGIMPQGKDTHTLFVSHDGMISNGFLWDDSWLEYDFIGAPWPSNWLENGELPYGKNRVGNMGFCLRSKKFIEACRETYEAYEYPFPSDVWCCQIKAEEFHKNGIKFAHPDVAALFSIENPCAEHRGIQSFGFHGFYGDRTPQKYGLTKFKK